MARLVLAATLGASYGIYGPAFELCEHAAARARQARSTWTRRSTRSGTGTSTGPDSLRDFIARVNRIRRENPALQADDSLRFHAVDNDQLICYSKPPEDRADIILVVVNLDPHHTQSGWVDLPLERARAGRRRRRSRCTTCSPARATCGRADGTTSSSTRTPSRRTSSACGAASAPSRISTTSCSGNGRTPMAEQRRQTIAPGDDPLWYKDAVIYELHVRAFFDSDGDGIGDFRGLTEKLDYLQDLGVTAIWLLPFYPSPLRDDGYDIADYTDVHPAYGTLRDFRRFLREAHRRGLRVITELVLNHTSDQHPWFQRARRAPPGQPLARLLRLERHAGQVPGRADHLQGLRDLELDLGPGGQGLLLAPLLLATSRT